MEAKGTAVKTIHDFVKKRYSDRFQEWINSLPAESKKIFSDGIYAVTWYPIDTAITIPTQKVSELFFSNIREGAWQCGRFSAEDALTGIYKLYVKLANPGHIIERANRVFAAYYQPSEMIVKERKANSVIVHITKFAKPNEIVECRIAGWMERALEISGCKNVKVTITQSLTKGNSVSEFVMNWG
jgi:hypothetical protein